MKYHLEWPSELQVIEHKFNAEIDGLEKEYCFKDHSSTFYLIIDEKIASMKEFLNIMERNPKISIRELARVVDHKLITAEKAMDSANNVFESDKRFNTVRILGRIKYLIIENNGRVDDYYSQQSEDDNDDNDAY